MVIKKLFLLLVVLPLCVKLPAQLCQGSLGDPIINITFGAGPNPGQALRTTTNLSYVTNSCPDDGYYTVRNSTNSCFFNTWHSLYTDHTGDPGGYFMLINASLQKSEFYLDTVKGLCPGTTYEFAAWVVNVIVPSACGGNTIPPNLTFNIETASGTILNTYSTGDIAATGSPTWKQSGFFFATPSGVSEVVLRIINNSQGGCGNDLAIDDITFRPCGAQLAAAFADGTPGDLKHLCEGDNANVIFTCNVSQGYTNPIYQWQLSTDEGVSWTDVPGANSKTLARSFTSATPPGSYSYRLTVVETANSTVTTCRVASGALTVQVHEKPGFAANNGPLCEHDSLVLTARGGANYQWTSANGFTASGDSIVISDATQTNAGKYYVSIVSAQGCAANDSTEVAVNPRPVAAVESSDTTICQGTYIALKSSGGGSYLWLPSAGLSNVNISNPIATPTDSTRYKLIVSNQFACSDSAFVIVNVVPKPVVDAGPDQFISEGSSVQLAANVKSNVGVLLWSPVISISDIHILRPTVSPIVNTRYILSLTANSGCGVFTDSVTVFVYKKIIVPNAFSPNGDGINDTWNITALTTYFDYDLTVFNRYGQIVLQTKNYRTQWDGTYNGKPLPVGTYYYLIDVRNPLPKLSGYVTILR